MKIGDRIKQRRELLGMSQEELAIRLGYKSRSSINKIERDASGLPQSKILAIATALGTTPDYLLGWEDDSLHLVISSSDPQITELLEYARQLNAQGLERLCSYAEDLCESQKYQKSDSKKKNPSP